MKDIDILIVEDELIIAGELGIKLGFNGFNVLPIASNGLEAVELALRHVPRIILMDIQLRGEIDGIEAARRIREQKTIPVVFLTGNSHMETDPRLLKTQPAAVITKPYTDHQLLETLRGALER